MTGFIVSAVQNIGKFFQRDTPTEQLVLMLKRYFYLCSKLNIGGEGPGETSRNKFAQNTL